MGKTCINCKNYDVCGDDKRTKECKDKEVWNGGRQFKNKKEEMEHMINYDWDNDDYN